MKDVAVVDASVALRWFVRDALSERSRDDVRDKERIAPSLVIFEIVQAVWKLARAQQLPRPQAEEVAAEIARHFQRLVDGDALAQEALALARSLGHSAHDCFYLALARREGAVLVTADRRLEVLASRSGVQIAFIGNHIGPIAVTSAS
jgi:predicted nucleic acid-binding protein